VLDREGMPPLPLASARNLIGAGARKLIERGLEVGGGTVTLGELDRMMRDFIDYYAEHIADESRPFEGLEAALDDLEGRGYRFAVCTNKLEWLSKLLLERLGLTHRFAAICGADTFGVAKPDPAILHQTVARAGISVVGVSFGYTEVPLADLKPDRLIGHMSDLPEAVESLMKSN
jgi:phosphoglycolate phosphatase